MMLKNTVSAAYEESWNYDAELDLHGKATVASRGRWGDFRHDSRAFDYFGCADISFSLLSLASQYRPNYSSLDATGTICRARQNRRRCFWFPTGYRGFPVLSPLRLAALSPDTPDKKPLEFR